MSVADVDIKKAAARLLCEQDHLFFTRYFFRQRQQLKFIVNWHHVMMADALQDVIDGKCENLILNVAPGASKTEIVVINFIARGLALNPRARFLHLSGSNELASLNSSTARDLVTSDEYQAFWPIRIADDAKAKKRWNVEIDGQPAGGVYATSLGGQITGFRAGHMADGFQGAIIIDDPIKPEDAFSPAKLAQANRKLLTTVKSRRANPKTPIVIVMQRIAENDPVGFIQKGNLPGKWRIVRIPAVLDQEYLEKLKDKYRAMIPAEREEVEGRFSYWPYKEPLKDLLAMERGEGADASGSRISRHVFAAQYNQTPVALGGNVIHGHHFTRYTVLPKIKYRKIFADTAQKAKEANDYSVFEEWGLGIDGRIYLIDMIRGKWESPELRRRAVAFWNSAKARDADKYGILRKMPIEDKSSGTDLIQTLKMPPHNIPVEPIERGPERDRYTRVMDALPYVEVGAVCIPEEAPFTHDFVAECEAFTADDTHDHDDQIDPMVDAVMDLLSSGNKIKQWAALGKKEGASGTR